MPVPVNDMSVELARSQVSSRSVISMMVFAVLGVIVCDLKALGMATCMGGGSSKTQFHCIWNACRRF